MKPKSRKTSTQLKNVYTLTQNAQLVHFSNAVQLCLSLQVPCLCNNSERHEMVPGGQGSVDFGLAAPWHRSGGYSPFQHLPPRPLGNTRAGLVVLSAQKDLSGHPVTPAAMSTRHKR